MILIVCAPAMPPKFILASSLDIIPFMSLVLTYTLMRVRVRDNRNQSVSLLKDKVANLPFLEHDVDFS